MHSCDSSPNIQPETEQWPNHGDQLQGVNCLARALQWMLGCLVDGLVVVLGATVVRVLSCPAQPRQQDRPRVYLELHHSYTVQG